MALTFIQVTGVTFTLISAIFLIRGSISLSLNDMVELSLTKWGVNVEVLKNLSGNFVNTKTGFVFILSGFVFQVINLLWPYTIDDVGNFDKIGVVLALCFSLLSCIGALILTKRMRRRIFERAEKILAERLKGDKKNG